MGEISPRRMRIREDVLFSVAVNRQRSDGWATRRDGRRREHQEDEKRGAHRAAHEPPDENTMERGPLEFIPESLLCRPSPLAAELLRPSVERLLLLFRSCGSELFQRRIDAIA